VGGVLATRPPKTAPADGYNILLTNSSILGANQFLYKDLPYDPVADFEHISLLAGSGSIAIVRKDSPFKTIPQLVQQAKAKPGQIFFGYYASSSQVPPQTLQARANIDIRGVPYKNITQITTDLIGGQIQFAFLDYASAISALNSAQLMPIAVTSRATHPLWPNLPRLGSYYAGMDFEGWYGLSAPKGIPQEAVARLARAVATVQADPAFQAQLQKLGYLPLRKSSREYAEVVGNEKAKWARQMKAANILID
jgi:tripartite-type tricarboxylate transporter receptor subunit TctC